MVTIGLTGGIGSGKTVVAHILADLGAHVIDADAVGHAVYRPGTPGWQQVVDAFGREIVTPEGTIDRKKLGAVVFADPAARERLNAIVHPLIGADIATQLDRARRELVIPAVVIEAAVLLEARWHTLLDEVWVVVADPSRIAERLRSQRRLPAEEVAARQAAQMSDAERRPLADVVIENTGTLSDLRRQVETLWHTRIRGRGKASDESV